MKYKNLNYLIIIGEDKRTGTGQFCYSVYCPSLSLVDSGDNIEEAKINMEKLIAFHLECLGEDGLAPLSFANRVSLRNIMLDT